MGLKRRFYRIGPAHEDSFFDDGIGCNGINAGISYRRLRIQVGRHLGWSAYIQWQLPFICIAFGPWYIQVMTDDHDWQVGRGR